MDATRPPRQRPRRHQGDREVERATMEALERLLVNASVHEIQVADLIREAGVSKAGFYFYFASKYDVVGALAGEIFAEIGVKAEGWAGDASAPAHMLDALQVSVDLWLAHGPVMAALHESCHVEPTLDAVWAGISQGFTGTIAKQIRAERRRGASPPGAPAETVAAMLVWGTGRALYVAHTAADAGLAEMSDAVDAIRAWWIAAIYGTTLPGPNG